MNFPRAKTQLTIGLLGAWLLESLILVLRRLLGPEPNVPAVIAAGLAMAVIYFLSLYGFEHTPDRRSATMALVLAAILFRLTLAPTTPVLSDDLYRYRFDAQVQALGLNPYTVQPDDPQLAGLRVPSIRAIPGHNIRGVYPPLSELLFGLTGRRWSDPIHFKIPFVLADLVLVGLLARQAWRGRLRNWQLALYAWHPLVIVEFAASGHNDALALVAAVGATLLLERRPQLSTLLLTAGILTKLFPLLLLPLWLRRLGWPRRHWTAVLASAALAAACLWPYRSAWNVWPTTVRQYEHSFRDNNASLYTLLRWGTHSPRLALAVGLGLVLGLTIWTTLRRLDPSVAAVLLFGTTLLVAPNAYPWYFTWVIPFLALRGNGPLVPAWLLLTVLQFLSYHVLIGYFSQGRWQFSPGMLLLAYLPFYGWLFWHWSERFGQALRRPSLPQRI